MVEVAKEIDGNNLKKYLLVAYDKDNDYYAYLATGDNLDEMTEKLLEAQKKIERDELRRGRDGESFDYVFVEEVETRRLVRG